MSAKILSMQVVDCAMPFSELSGRINIAPGDGIPYDDGTQCPVMLGEIAWGMTADQWDLAFVAGEMPRSWRRPLSNSNKSTQPPRGWIVAYETKQHKRSGTVRLLAGPLNHNSAIKLEAAMDDTLGFTGEVERRPDLQAYVQWLQRAIR